VSASAEDGENTAFTWTVGALTAVFLLLPLGIVVVQSFTAESFLRFPPAAFGVRWYDYVFHQQVWRAAAGRSVLIGAIVAPFATVVGTMAAFAVDRGPRALVGMIYGILISPMILPHVVLALGLLRIALLAEADDTYAALIVAHLVVAVPYVVITVGASLRIADRSLEDAAQSLGANAWRVFRHVVLPAIWPGLFAGLIFAFVESFDEFIITFFLTTFKLTLPIQIFNTLSYQLEPSIAVVSTLVLALTGFLTALVLRRGQTLPTRER